eukprot:6169342-Prymnesium_polylepis.1
MALDRALVEYCIRLLCRLCIFVGLDPGRLHRLACRLVRLQRLRLRHLGCLGRLLLVACVLRLLE